MIYHFNTHRSGAAEVELEAYKTLSASNLSTAPCLQSTFEKSLAIRAFSYIPLFEEE